MLKYWWNFKLNSKLNFIVFHQFSILNAVYFKFCFWIKIYPWKIIYDDYDFLHIKYKLYVIYYIILARCSQLATTLWLCHEASLTYVLTVFRWGNHEKNLKTTNRYYLPYGSPPQMRSGSTIQKLLNLIVMRASMRGGDWLTSANHLHAFSIIWMGIADCTRIEDPCMYILTEHPLL